MSTKTSSTPVFALRIVHPESVYMLKRALRIVLTLQGKRRLVLEGDRVRVDQDRLVFRLSQGETKALGAKNVQIEASVALPHGTVLKTVTKSFPLTQALLDEPI